MLNAADAAANWIAETISGSADAASEIKPGVIKTFLEELPDKALRLGVRILLALLFFIIGAQIIKLIRKIVKKSMTRANADKGAIQFVDSFAKAAMYVILAFMIATYVGMDAASIVALLGSAGVAIGLAVQGSLSNLAGGVLLLLLKPFKVGDYIITTVGSHEGTVEEIQVFYTKLLTPDHKVIVLPNGSLANNSLTNVTAAKTRRMDVLVGISYKADLKLAKETLMKILMDDSAVIKDMEIKVYVNELAGSCVQIGLRCWFLNDDYWEGKWRITENAKYALDRAGIEIPFPQLDIHVKEAADK